MRIHQTGCCMVLALFAAGPVFQTEAQVSIGKTNITKISPSGSASPTSGKSTTYNTVYQVVSRPDVDLPAARRLSVTTGFSPLAPANALSIPAPHPNSISGSNLGVAFEGLTTVDSAYANGFVLSPPDQGLCAGHGYVLEIINLALKVFNTSGGALSAPESLNNFFGVDPKTTTLADPRCYYDAPTQRWFASVTDAYNSVTGRSGLVLAVSLTSDPNGLWYVYTIDTTDDGNNGTPSNPSCPCFADQPLLGADVNGVYLTTNEFGLFAPGFNGAQVYALSKSALESGTPTALVHFYDIPLAEGYSYSLQPASSPDLSSESASGTEYFLSALDFSNSLDNRVAVWAITNTRSLSNAIPSVSLTNTVIRSETYGVPVAGAPQKAGPYPLGQALGEPEETLSPGDDRMQNVVYASGHLWGGLDTVISDGTNLNTGIAYFDVKPSMSHGVLTAEVQGQGYISLQGNSVIYPGIGVTADGTAAVAFTVTGNSFYPSAAYSHLTPSHSLAVNIVAPGGAPQDDFSGYGAFGGGGVARWGDYSWGVADGNSLWLATEYIPGNINSLDFFTNYGTYIWKLNLH